MADVTIDYVFRPVLTLDVINAKALLMLALIIIMADVSTDNVFRPVLEARGEE